MPLGDELFGEILAEKERLGYYPVIDKDVARFIEYRKLVHRETLSPDQINLEDFISYLDIEHYLRLKGSDTWSDEGNPSQIAIRNLIARVLHAKANVIPAEAYKVYEAFADRLQPGDYVVTFNYDTVLETVLERVRKPYRLVPERATSPQDEFGIPQEDEVILLKMHGSIDWFDIEPFHRACESWKQEEHYQHPRHAVFNDYSTFWPKRIADRYYDATPLGGIYRVSDLGRYFDHPAHGVESPLILSPSFSKILYMNPLRDFWYGFYAAGSFHNRVAVIGFSLPEHDQYVLQPIGNCITIFQSPYSMISSEEKTRLKIVDRRTTQDEIDAFRRVYSFVDWDNTDCYFGGFDEDAIKLIFDEG